MSTSPIVLKPACIKTLSAVEAHPSRSNQHEFNGVTELKQIFGLTRFNQSAHFSIRGTDITAVANVSWYDARDAHPTRSEYRLYFQENNVMRHAHEGANIIVGFDKDKCLHIILIPSGSPDYTTGIKGWQQI